MKRPNLLYAFVIAGSLLASANVHAADPVFLDYTKVLDGTTADYRWSGFSDETKPDGVTAGTGGVASEWSAGIKPANDSTNIVFSGTPGFGSDTTYFLADSSGGGIYSFFSATHYSVISSNPLAGLQTLTLQISQAVGLSSPMPGPGNESTEFFLLPSLTLQLQGGGNTVLSADYSLLTSSTSAVFFDNPTNVVTWGFQWDLSSLTEEVTGYQIDWQLGYHSILLGADATESDAFAENILAVPEPSTWSLLGASAMVGLVMMRRKRCKAA